MRYWYLATPYAKFEGGAEAAYQEACVWAGKFMRLGVPVFCPIAHTHGIARFMPAQTHQFWLDQDFPLLRNSVGVLIPPMEGWDHSVGIQREREACRTWRLRQYVVPAWFGRIHPEQPHDMRDEVVNFLKECCR